MLQMELWTHNSIKEKNSYFIFKMQIHVKGIKYET